ncbi:MAG: aminodeoxychorismate synthase component I [Pyrinomonadaceae bacterium]|nr:aminodeoxychorismate synthase component I [Pyrinomonadaceae bacterium]
MREIEFSADELTSALLDLSEHEQVCLLDSSGVSHLGSHLLIAGIRPLETYEIASGDAAKTLEFLDAKISNPNLAFIFSISYDFGLKLENIAPRPKEFASFNEPDIFLAAFDCLIIHDYETGKTHLTGNEGRFTEIEKTLVNRLKTVSLIQNQQNENAVVTSNFTRENYLQTIGKIQECIRRGETYQTNFTQQFRARLPENLTAQRIFRRLRKSHPAPFAAFLKRAVDFVVSISPERFFKVNGSGISTSPIKGTRARGATAEKDLDLKNELLTSEKDLAENTMIVDLLRNDLGRICEFGSVEVEKLCDLETHPTLHHLVSTIKGGLRENVGFSDIIKAVFPCGSITGAPKISTMRIIDELETTNRGLSMGAIGYYVPSPKSQVPSPKSQVSSFQSSAFSDLGLGTWDLGLDLSVAIRTMVIKNNEAVFNVGGGIVIDSVPEDEYAESLLKAQALFDAINADWRG